MAFAPAVVERKGCVERVVQVVGMCRWWRTTGVGVDRERHGIGGGSQWLAARHNDSRTSALTFSTYLVARRICEGLCLLVSSTVISRMKKKKSIFRRIYER